MEIIMEFAAMTDIGRQRKNNEDSYFVYKNKLLSGGMVADGMGGENAGEIASKMASDIIKQHIIQNYSPDMDYMAIAELIRTAFFIANREIYKKAQTKEYSGMGTTATLALIYEGKLIISHIGDSRCYLYSDGKLKQLTNDHSFVGELVRMGQISELDARNHPNRNLITRALGADVILKIDMNIINYSGEAVLLCSDGLTNMLSDDQIADILKNSESYDKAIKEMIQLANKKGGRDNITVIVFGNLKGEAE